MENEVDDEIVALELVVHAVKDLTDGQVERILDYVRERFVRLPRQIEKDQQR